jgi:superfamily I DNA/RNA helicase
LVGRRLNALGCKLARVTSILTAQGTRAAETCLVQAVLAQVDLARQDSKLLARPILVVVPSGELRLRLSQVLAQAGATLGVEVQTLHSLALTLHQSAGQVYPQTGALSEVLARRAAQAQPKLRLELAELEDGYSLAATSIRDLLSAGLQPESESRAQAGKPNQVDRHSGSGVGSALWNAALQTQVQMQDRQCRRPGDVQMAAAALVADHLPARKCYIYGFADAAGQARLLLQALIQHGASLIVDLPVDPAYPGNGREDRGCEFVRSFVQRLGLEIPPGPDSIPNAPTTPDATAAASAASTTPAQLQFFHAAGRSDEIREVGHRIRALLKQGVPTEDIGVVARVLDSYSTQIRHWFRELGIPFRSGLAPAGLFPAHRRMRAALEVLERRGDASVDRWLDALARSGASDLHPHRLEDLRIALRTLGAARLHQAGRLDVAKIVRGRNSFPLPVRRGFVESQGDAEAAEQTQHLQRRTLPISQLTTGIGAAAGLLEHLADWPEYGSLVQHAEFVRAFFATELGWRSNSASPVDDWAGMLQKLARLDQDSVDYSREEFLILLRAEAKSFGAQNLGGSGAGVAVLDVTRARGRSFEHLFAIGINRGAMPRPIREDPLLPDRIRAGFAALLPDLLGKSLGHLEERYLFAQLCSAASHATLSWLRADDEGKEIAPSPFLQRIWLAHGSATPDGGAHAVPRMRVDLYAEPDRCLTSREALAYAGLSGDRTDWASLLEKVLAQDGALSESARVHLSLGRRQVLEEFDPDYRSQSGGKVARSLGPYLGLLGRPALPLDRLFVTRLESFAKCPWQTLLNYGLRLERMQDPLAELPATDAALIGTVVHKALELLVGADVPAGEPYSAPITVGRPSGAQVNQCLAQAAQHIAEKEELRLAGLIEALIGQAKPLLETLVKLEWPEADSSLQVVGCEMKGSATIPLADGDQVVYFKADRVDQVDQTRIYTDYKTSKPFNSAAKEKTRKSNFLKGLKRGKLLQAAAYAFSAKDASGRYHYARLEEGKKIETASYAWSSDDLESKEAFHQVSATLLAGLEMGAAFPRMAEADDATKASEACKYCELADACLRQDSGTRRRMTNAINDLAEQRSENQGLEALPNNVLEQWYLGAKSIPWAVEEEEA